MAADTTVNDDEPAGGNVTGASVVGFGAHSNAGVMSGSSLHTQRIGWPPAAAHDAKHTST